MKLSSAASLAVLACAPLRAAAFAPSPFGIRQSVVPSTTSVFSDSEEGGLDLDLDEMFDMFDAADKGADFDKTVEKIKGDEKKKK
mmetsp:Transcript_14245/g.28421  ORF Transcript_14245/g.28421 Transcript_14245/m.28421 type:complete len:85 (-) Transcript_14245:196-450(-)|eukprot:CAMPEP_0194304360 /NCGR_PEP_ID=MMETSP0171-20130528/2134_1 /TAXON_ID=218684 /ORGANISM="Corethron pennatum, Strain L29A3" /LENGTH=84 /DNA_ID=CAMNT_0039055617 /DNA_START=91 /DNA_END=345 /DNA_ORIENTATION=+